ncbi:hypothetical protein T4A_14016 [Trichinella pseudospiralis]|uniref:Uncharacterized protein n=1 Tax=Trichinella pseudospiralis TaxID=6337 RepID=A0A0V1EFN0_TRIPS|nr:hypothetical protein T4A_14016 [Trichinella pseudospiralis]
MDLHGSLRGMDTAFAQHSCHGDVDHFWTSDDTITVWSCRFHQELHHFSRWGDKRYYRAGSIFLSETVSPHIQMLRLDAGISSMSNKYLIPSALLQVPCVNLDPAPERLD